MNFELAAKTLSLCYKTELVDGTDYEVHWIDEEEQLVATGYIGTDVQHITFTKRYDGTSFFGEDAKKLDACFISVVISHIQLIGINNQSGEEN